MQTKYTIGEDIIAGATEITLLDLNFTDGYKLNNAFFSSIVGDKGYFTLDQGNSLIEEQCSFTGIRDESNGYYTLTGVQSLSFYNTGSGNYPEYAVIGNGLRFTHVGGCKVVFGDSPAFWGAVVQNLNTPYVGVGLISVNSSNQISFTGYSTLSDSFNNTNSILSLNTATNSILGGIKVGSGLSINQEGVLSTTNSMPKIKSINGVFTRALNSPSETQLIVHGLGKIPDKVSIYAEFKTTASSYGDERATSTGKFNRTTMSCVYSAKSGLITDVGSSNNFILYIVNHYSGQYSTESQQATITIDDTNIILNWVKYDSGGASMPNLINVLWEAEIIE